MHKKTLLFSGALGLFAMGILDNAAYKNFWYWRFAWTDVIMHFIGGLSVGAFTLAFYTKRQEAVGWQRVLLLCLLSALVVGLIWELFEISLDKSLLADPLDSLKDICNGVLGSLLAGLLYNFSTAWQKK